MVGSTGAGKTTLVNLLMRFYEVNGGEIYRGRRIDAADMTRSGLRSNFGMVLQDTWLFGGTVAENIAYGKPDATREEIIAAAKAAKVDYFIRTMPHGYDTVLDNEAANLSAGQRQLLTIARVFLCDPPIMILDEATSSVDTRTEAEIGKAMKQLMKGRTSFVIAHRLSTIRDADTILFMDHGNIIEQGSHKELLEKKGRLCRPVLQPVRISKRSEPQRSGSFCLFCLSPADRLFILPQRGQCLRRKRDERDHIEYGHEAYADIAQIPHELIGSETADKQHDERQDLIDRLRRPAVAE